MDSKEILPPDYVLDAIFDVPPDLLFLMSEDEQILDFRAKQHVELYTSPDLFINKRMQDVLPAPVGELFAKNFKELIFLKEPQTFEYELANQGIRRTFKTRLSFLPDYSVVIAVIRDISEQKEASNEQKRLLAAIEQSGEAILITDINGDIDYINPAFEKMNGFRFDEIVGKNSNIFKSDQQFLKVINRMI